MRGSLHLRENLRLARQRLPWNRTSEEYRQRTLPSLVRRNHAVEQYPAEQYAGSEYVEESPSYYAEQTPASEPVREFVESSDPFAAQPAVQSEQLPSRFTSNTQTTVDGNAAQPTPAATPESSTVQTSDTEQNEDVFVTPPLWPHAPKASKSTATAAPERLKPISASVPTDWPPTF